MTVEQAARMAGIAAADLLGAIRQAVGEAEPPGNLVATPPDTSVATARPATLAARRPVHLDVREDIRSGIEPFARIMTAVKALAKEEALVLRAPFEPFPLYDVLGRRGFGHWAERRAADDWWVWFYREPPATAEARVVPPAASGPPAPPEGLTIDVRGLEPPLPMMCVLERLEGLTEETPLEVIHDRRPLFLYPQLDERGFAHETDEPEPGVVRIRIRKHPRGGP